MEATGNDPLPTGLAAVSLAFACAPAAISVALADRVQAAGSVDDGLGYFGATQMPAGQLEAAEASLNER